MTTAYIKPAKVNITTALAKQRAEARRLAALAAPKFDHAAERRSRSRKA